MHLTHAVHAAAVLYALGAVCTGKTLRSLNATHDSSLMGVSGLIDPTNGLSADARDVFEEHTGESGAWLDAVSARIHSEQALWAEKLNVIDAIAAGCTALLESNCADQLIVADYVRELEQIEERVERSQRAVSEASEAVNEALGKSASLLEERFNAQQWSLRCEAVDESSSALHSDDYFQGIYCFSIHASKGRSPIAEHASIAGTLSYGVEVAMGYLNAALHHGAESYRDALSMAAASSPGEPLPHHVIHDLHSVREAISTLASDLLRNHAMFVDAYAKSAVVEYYRRSMAVMGL
jgi:hypothetical protein